MKLNLGPKALIFCLLALASVCSWAQDEAVVPANEKPPLVEVEHHQDNLANYKERQENHGFFVGVNFEPVDLKNYISTLDGKTYGDLFGSNTVGLIHLMLDYKFNTSIGSFAVGVDYGRGEVQSAKSGANRSLKLNRYGLGAKFTMDMLMDEPYVAPYLGINFWQMGITEASPTNSFSATTKMGYNYSVGLLIQLNFFDRNTATDTTYNWGLENTFLDLYTTKYAKTQADGDPNTETDFLYGAGLRLEF